jgi:alpha-beta hydrolase superfamily lysophospholipase
MLLLCPGLKAKVKPSVALRGRIVLASRLRPKRLFPIPLNEPELFTASAEGQKFIDADPLGLRFATARFLFNSFALDVYLRRAAKRVTVPTLLTLAEHDRIIVNARTREYVSQFRGETQTLEYPGAHHTLEFEPPEHPWIGDVVKWIEGRL